MAQTISIEICEVSKYKCCDKEMKAQYDDNVGSNVNYPSNGGGGGGAGGTCNVFCSDGPPCVEEELGPSYCGGDDRRASNGGNGARANPGKIYDGGGHAFENRYVKPDPQKAPLSVCPEYQRPPKKPRTPPERLRFDLERTKSRALIGGTLYTGCDCVRRNGLQDQCRRTECRGRPECMSRPEPTCAPSMGPMNLTREEVEAKKVVPKPYLKLCCKCPPDCYEKKQQQQQQQQTQRRSGCRESQQRNPCGGGSQGRNAGGGGSRHRRNARMCCFKCTPADKDHIQPHDEGRFKGQFDKRLLCQEVDPVRGPLMNHG